MARLKIQKIMKARNDNYMHTISMLQECYTTCQKALTTNMPKEAGESLAYLHLKRLQACAEICDSTVRLLLKNGIGTERLCEIAARICEQCANSCEKMNEPDMDRITELCRQTANACMDESYRIKMQMS